MNHLFPGDGDKKGDYQGCILLVPSVFGRQQLNSKMTRLCRRSFPFPKEQLYRFGRFCRL